MSGAARRAEGNPAAATVDVLIVGAGPVGKLLAIQLGRRGHRVVVVDRNAASYPLPRAVTHCADVARILQSIGLGPDTIPQITEPFDDVYRWRNGDGQVLLDVDWGGRGESGWYNTYFFHQPDLEDAFDRLLADLPSVTVMRRQQVMAVAQHRDRATVVVESTTGGEHAAISARWVIGADGANSTVRGLLDIEWRDDGYFSDWLVVDVRLHSKATGFAHVAAQHCDPARPSTMVPGGPGRRRWEFMRLPQETCGELDRAETAWKLLAPHGIRPDNAELERHSVYTFRACAATEWRRGRVFLAGDAAHLMPPFAGQGLGAGLRDAHNLSWKLSAVLRGAAAEQLLDTYATERQQHTRAFIEFSTRLGRIVCITDPQKAAARDHEMTADRHTRTALAVPPRPALGPGLHIGPHGGAVGRQGRIRLHGEARTALSDDIFGGAGAVISRGAEPLERLEPSLYATLRDLDITLVAMSGAPRRARRIDDVDGVYGRWLDELGADTVLIRPDFHVFGAASAEATTGLVEGFCVGAGRQVHAGRQVQKTPWPPSGMTPGSTTG